MKKNLIDEKWLSKYVTKKDPIVVCVSTGIDSMSLFHYLYTNGYNVIVAHVNHKRRIESDYEYEYLKDYSIKNNIPFEGHVILDKIDSNFQEEARYIRIDFFKRVAKKYNAKAIVLAHQADDMVETVIMRLTRGTSIKGYSGIKDVTESDGIYILRPLLKTTRKEIENYQKKYNIKYFEDSSNSTDHYTRNTIRHNVIPTLKEINPNLYSEIENYRKDLEDTSELVMDLSNAFLKEHMELISDNLVLNRAKFNELKAIIKKGVLLTSLNIFSKDTLEMTHEKMDEIISNSSKNQEERITEIRDDVIVITEYNTITFTRKKDIKQAECTISDFKKYELCDGTIINISQKTHPLQNKNTYMLCYNNIDDLWPIKVRNIVEGDKITYNGITKKCFDLLKENKVPRRYRKETLCFLDKNDNIFFIPGIIRKETNTNLENRIYIIVERKEI